MCLNSDWLSKVKLTYEPSFFVIHAPVNQSKCGLLINLYDICQLSMEGEALFCCCFYVKLKTKETKVGMSIAQNKMA